MSEEGKHLDVDAAATLTRLLQEAHVGDPIAAARLLPLVYGQLRALADRKMRGERLDQTLQATALVHEAYLRLVGGEAAQGWDGCGHFFAAAAEAMRRILIERARRRQRIRHGGGRQRVDLERLATQAGNDDDPNGNADDLLALNDALTRLAAEDADAGEIVKLRYFAGLTIEQSAAAMDISVRTANRHWAYAKAWLYQHLNDPGEAGR